MEVPPQDQKAAASGVSNGDEKPRPPTIMDEVLRERTVVEEYRDRITAIYKEKQPEKVSEVDNFLKKYQGQEHVLYLKICKKYSVPEQPQYRGNCPFGRGLAGIKTAGDLKMPFSSDLGNPGSSSPTSATGSGVLSNSSSVDSSLSARPPSFEKLPAKIPAPQDIRTAGISTTDEAATGAPAPSFSLSAGPLGSLKSGGFGSSLATQAFTPPNKPSTAASPGVSGDREATSPLFPSGMSLGASNGRERSRSPPLKKVQFLGSLASDVPTAVTRASGPAQVAPEEVWAILYRGELRGTLAQFESKIVSVHKGKEGARAGAEKEMASRKADIAKTAKTEDVVEGSTSSSGEFACGFRVKGMGASGENVGLCEWFLTRHSIT